MHAVQQALIALVEIGIDLLELLLRLVLGVNAGRA